MMEEERFEQAVEALLADRSPHRAVHGLSDEHKRILRLVQRLRGMRGQDPSVEFVERLRVRLRPPVLLGTQSR